MLLSSINKNYKSVSWRNIVILKQSFCDVKMRLLPLQKNIPSLHDKKSTLRVNRPLPILSNPSFIQFQKIKEVIINTESLPISIHIQRIDTNELIILITPNSISVKNREESFSLPFHVPKHNWFKIDFGTEFKKIEIRAKFNENKLKRINFYSSLEAWKNEHHEQQLPIDLADLKPLLRSLQGRRQNAQNKSHQQTKQIGGLIRAKLSERANSYSYKQTLGTRRNNENSVRVRMSNDKHGHLPSHAKKNISTTLTHNTYFQTKQKIGKRTSNTSNSVRSQSNDAELKVKKIVQRSYKPSFAPSFFDQTSQLVPICKGKPRPRFYQQIPFTHEQIELKRKKYESQYIIKKEVLLSNTLRNNESQVTEDIIKCQNSRLTHLEDTLERGILQQRAVNLQQSGTLCQSVFE